MTTTEQPSTRNGSDPLLTALAQTRREQQDADRWVRLLLAYARECTRPRPYRLTDLAEASGLSISGVRTAYTAAHVREVTLLLACLDHNRYPPDA